MVARRHQPSQGLGCDDRQQRGRGRGHRHRDPAEPSGHPRIAQPGGGLRHDQRPRHRQRRRRPRQRPDRSRRRGGGRRVLPRQPGPARQLARNARGRNHRRGQHEQRHRCRRHQLERQGPGGARARKVRRDDGRHQRRNPLGRGTSGPWGAEQHHPGQGDQHEPGDPSREPACSLSPSTQAAINDAVAMGATVVVAAGNDATDASQVFPASCNNVITVAASDLRGHLATRYSNYGATVEIMAPGGRCPPGRRQCGRPSGRRAEHGAPERRDLCLLQRNLHGGPARGRGRGPPAGATARSGAEPGARQAAGERPAAYRGAVPAALRRRPAERRDRAGATAAAPAANPLAMALSLDNNDLGANDSTIARATVTQGGAPVAGKTVAFASANPAVASRRAGNRRHRWKRASRLRRQRGVPGPNHGECNRQRIYRHQADEGPLICRCWGCV